MASSELAEDELMDLGVLPPFLYLDGSQKLLAVILSRLLQHRPVEKACLYWFPLELDLEAVRAD